MIIIASKVVVTSTSDEGNKVGKEGKDRLDSSNAPRIISSESVSLSGLVYMCVEL